MGVRESYEKELESLKQSIIDMGESVLNGFKEALTALETANTNHMNQIIKQDEKINELELNIHDEATIMIAKQQPVATDLRTAIVALKVSSDLERVGDLTVDMMKSGKRMKTGVMEENKEELFQIAEHAQEMLKKSLQAYTQGDLLLAQHISVLDDKVDELYSRYIKRLFRGAQEESYIEQVTQLAFIGRYVERIADYATNVAEWIVYESNGKHFDLN